MRVFIADDSRIVVDRLADLLKDVPKLKVIGTAGSVTEAIPAIQSANPDAVILDLEMPGGSGLDVLREIHQLRPSMSFLVFTNYCYPNCKEECLAAGASFVLDKSSDFERLCEILRRMSTGKAKAIKAGR